MNEAAVVQQLRRRLKELLPHAIVYKINDLSSAGIPDLAIIYRGFTLWLEVKYFREGESEKAVAKHLDPRQLASLVLLERQTPSYYLLAYRADRELWAAAYSPGELRREDVAGLAARWFFHAAKVGPLAETVRFLAGLLQ